MRKILLLMWALLTLGASGAWAETPNILAYPESGKVYYITGYNANAGGSEKKAYLYADGNAIKGDIDYTKNGAFAYLWLCVKSGSGYTLQSLSTGKYFDGPYPSGNATKAKLSDTGTEYSFSQAVQDAQCVSLCANSQWLVVSLTVDNKAVDRLNGSYNYYSNEWCSDFLFEEYAAATPSHNQYYYIYCDNDNQEASGTGTDIRQYLYNGTSATIPVQTDESQVSLTNYAWRAIRYYDSENPTYDYFYFKNGSKYLAFHSLADSPYKWKTNHTTNKDAADANGTGRVDIWGYRAASSGDRFLALNYADTENSSSGGCSDKRGGLQKYAGAWSQNFMFVIAPQTNVYKVAIKVEAPSDVNAVFTFDGFDYSGDCSIYVDGNNLPETKAISVKSSDFSFKGFYLEDGTSLGTTIDVSALTANKGVIARFYPFKLSTSYADATWYHMNVGGNWAYFNGTNFPVVTDIDDAKATADKSCWAFIATTGGINVINHAAGSSKYVSSGATPLVMIDSSTGFAIWTCSLREDYVSFTLDNGGYYMQSGPWEGVGNGLGYEQNAASAASSRIYVEPVDWGEIALAYKTSIQSDLDKAGSVGYPMTSYSSYESLESEIANITTLGTSYSKSNYEDLVDAYNAYLATPDAGITKPVAGKFYTIYNPSASKYIHSVDKGEILAGSTDGTSSNAVFYVPVANRFLSYANGYAMKERNISSDLYSSDGYSEYTMDHYSSHQFGTLRIKYSSGYLYLKSDESEVGNTGWYGNEERCAWTIEEVTSLPVTISPIEYTSFYAPVDVIVPTGVTAYYGTISGDKLILTAIEAGSKIPANTGVILEGTANANVSMEITTDAESIGSNALDGTVATKATTEGDLVLGYENETVGLYKLNTSENLKGFKSYIPAAIAGSVKSMSFSFDYETTAIEALRQARKSNEVYDLNGRRVERAEKGIYIVNGQKVIIR